MKIGIFGVGQLGMMHARILDRLTDSFRITGFVDPDDEAAETMIRTYGLKRYFDADALIDASDCIDIVTPTIDHFDLATRAIKKSKHVFIEKPVTQTVAEAKVLLQLASEASVQVQVGYIERFHPAFLSALPAIRRPRLIEAHRLASCSPEASGISVVQDLMIHDLDLVLSLVQSNIKRVSANGVAVLGGTPDIVSARIEFDNGCVANLTASRISQTSTRTMQVFQRHSHVSVDFMEKTVAVAHQLATAECLASDEGFAPVLPEPSNAFAIESPTVPAMHAMEAAFRSFAHSIRTNSIPVVSLEDAYRSMLLATQITDRLKLAGSAHCDYI